MRMKRIVYLWMSFCCGLISINAQTTYHYDVNNDGEVTISDVIAVINDILYPPEAIDLGLPSGTKWASCNIGTTRPEEAGEYYAWGQVYEVEDYTWSSYVHCDGKESTCHDLGDNISGTDYDVARAKWGTKWQMPSLSDFRELFDNCTTEWTTMKDLNGNSVIGRKYTSKKNGKSIFFPAAGYRASTSLLDNGNYGFYWISQKEHISGYLDPEQAVYSALFLRISSSSSQPQGFQYAERFYGFMVRPISR